MDASSRLFRLLRAITEDKVASIENFIDQGSSRIDEKLKYWEKELGLDAEENVTPHEQEDQPHDRRGQSRYPQYPQQFVDDLQLFNLTPPSSLTEVKKIRNEEMKKFHPDKYQNDAEKIETAKRIVQIYNAAYERLKKSFKAMAQS